MLDDQDRQRLRTALDLAGRVTEENSFARTIGDASAAEIASCVTFDHIATLVFADRPQDVRTFLDDAGFDATAPVPSVVVRRRLAARYTVSEDELDVAIVHGFRRHGSDCGIEVFIVPRAVADRIAPDFVARERATDTESHLAWLVAPGSLDMVRRVCHERLALRPDGGGYNPGAMARVKLTLRGACSRIGHRRILP